MIAMWRLRDSRDLKGLNAPRTLLVSAANAVADQVRCRACDALARIIRAIALFATSCITLAYLVRAYAVALMIDVLLMCFVL